MLSATGLLSLSRTALFDIQTAVYLLDTLMLNTSIKLYNLSLPRLSFALILQL